ncbi:MAG: hypothetical protein ABSB15_01260 [Bryobacteraceae bacterium]
MKRILLVVLFLLLALGITLGIMRSRAASIEPASPSGIVSFTATPRVVNAGEASTLAWVTRGADSVTMEWGPAAKPRDAMERRTGLPPVGTLTVRPEEDTVYVIECQGGSGQACTAASATVRVKKP